ncbi:MAG: hypothetical protein VKJ64_15310 [Leptolyngbyaceae bacterium]|nr:hypothetical protein [Leptolyngbyaceae bacterium]
MGTSVSDKVRQYLKTAPKRTRTIIREAQRIEMFLSNIMQLGGLQDDAWDFCQEYPTLRQINSLGKQIVIRMFRSNPRFQGYKVDFDRHMLNPNVLFLAGSLCEQFDYAHTSPLFGLNILDIGCGALSEYASLAKDANLLSQFYSDRPPIGAELLQMLGAKTIGLDPRGNAAELYDYQVAYRHRVVEFDAIDQWVKDYVNKFDIVSCLNLFKRHSFLYGHSEPEQITRFLVGVRRSLVAKGLVYSTTPLPPSTSENRQTNRRIFQNAGFQILHEGYYLIAERL